MFSETNRDSEVSDDRIFRIMLARIGVESRWQIDREDERIFFATQTMDLTHGGTDRFAQERFRTGTEQAIQNNDVRCAVEGIGRLGSRIAQRFQFLLCQFAAIFFHEWQPDVDLPSDSLQLFCRDKRVAAVVAFAGEHNTRRRFWKKLPNGAGN